ncbi:hypothetical protein RvY_12009-2 [Ramazzottius varieornatus]|uniref:Uncharacterized protein n=1 Tax=Ramazzottius varieornatus TaxID=947166 RepID=A0A1D1VK27_RAMVA|nr:hypothetical protein RvY_12009-2 [Ramazzottius varieornatus]
MGRGESAGKACSRITSRVDRDFFNIFRYFRNFDGNTYVSDEFCSFYRPNQISFTLHSDCRVLSTALTVMASRYGFGALRFSSNSVTLQFDLNTNKLENPVSQCFRLQCRSRVKKVTALKIVSDRRDGEFGLEL